MPPLVVSIACRKGGVGKTTTAIGIASWFAKMGKRTALIELDDQGNAAYSLNCQLDGPGAAQLLLGQPVEPQTVPGQDNFAIYVGTVDLLGGAINELDAEHLGDQVVNLPFDVVVIDCPPKGEHLERLGLSASTVALIPVSPHPLAVNGALRIHNLITTRQERNRPAPNRVALVATRIDDRKKLDRSLFEGLQASFTGIPVFTVRSDETVAKDMADQVSFVLAHGDCRGSQDYQAIVEWIMGAMP